MNVFRHLAGRARRAALRAARPASRGARSQRPRRRAVGIGTVLGVAVTVAWLLSRLTIGSGGAGIERAGGAADRWREIGRQIEALQTLEPGRRGGNTVEGRARDLDAIADRLGELTSSPRFSDVELRKVTADPEAPGGSPAPPVYRFTVALAAVFPGRSTADAAVPRDPPAVPATASSAAAGPADGAGEPRRDPFPPIFGPFPAAGASILSAPDWLAEVTVDEIEILAVAQTSLGALARARCARRDGRPCDGTLLIGPGDRLNDGEVAWVGFLSPRLAAVRLKQRLWPPPWEKKPYREVLRVLGWESVAGAEPRQESLPVPRGPLQGPMQHPLGGWGGQLLVVGREALGSWPDGRYVPRRETLVRQIGGEPLPRVDLFAAVFYESYGLFPWQHPSWSPRGWTIEEGFPFLGSIGDLEAPARGQAPAGERSAELSAVDARLALDGEVLSNPRIYSYDPGSRPDPFRSPAERRHFARSGPAGRPAGLAGLRVDEIELDEIYRTPRGPVAEVSNPGWFRPLTLRPGDQLWDGEVVAVHRTGVVLKQTVSDPTALKPFREVVKRPRRGARLRRTW